MEISLRSFTLDDIHSLKQWALDIEVEKYQSRIFPRAFNDRDFSGSDGLWAWYVILADGEEAGTVWLEKETPESEQAILGIMLANKKYFGKGIGRQAILMVIEQALESLGFNRVVLTVRRDNTRAIASYQRVGFTISEEGIREYQDGTRIPYYFMELDLDASSVKL